MRRRRSALLLLALLAALALLVAACGGDDSDGGSSEPADAPAEPADAPAEPAESGGVSFSGSIEDEVPVGYDEPEPGEFTLGYLNPLQANEFLNTMGRAMRLETERLGGELVELDAQLDVDTQVSQFDQLIAQEVDGIFVFPLDPGSVQPAVERAKEAGIAVITIDLNFESSTDIGSLRQPDLATSR